MHLADGTLSNQICTAVGSAAAVAFAASRARPSLHRARLTRAALVFGAVITAGVVAVVLHARSAAGVAASGAGRN
ncbi:MAG TPA: hypothetical protein VFT13_04770 [Candidatus Krumholzibacteria bacterium]|nr:hypothetical protein [Candidatus Krumholzibacteria bacterium]